MDDVIIVGSLDKRELEKSIQDLVNYVGDKTNTMASKFTEGLDKMKLAMKDFAITQKVSVDTMQEAWRKMSQSFDAMVAAQSAGSRGSSSGGGASATQNSIKDLKEQITAAERLRDTFQQTSPQVAAINKQIEDMRTRLQSILAKGTLKESMANARKEISAATSMPTKMLADAQTKLRALESIQAKYANTTILSQQQTNRLATAIQNCKDKIDKIRNAQPKTIKDVLGMDESSVDAIAKKMQALRRVSIDPNNKTQVKQLGDEYQRLSKLQTQLIGKNAQAIRSNNMLAQSFGYIRNRVVYALTLGAMSNFVKQVLEIRGQYELLERSLGVLVGSFERGSEIFNELNQMAIKSPFTLIELGTAAKQLTAYNFAADEVVDTTRRLADISAALGVSMERLTYNLGQIKAQGFLNARDARDFANAGLAIVPMLAQMYTEQKRFGDQIVTTAQVYDMMSKKLVSYSDVLQVLYKITDEGGKFFDFQAKQAETLKVQINNLALAMNNMYNEIGASNQGFLVSSVQTIKKIFENWKTVLSIIQSLIVTYGAYRAILAVVNFEHQRTWGTRIIVGITQYINAIRSATGTMATFNAVMSSNVVVAFASALMGLASYFLFFRQSVNKTTVDIERFGESGAKTISNIETLGKILKGVDENTALYKKTVGELNQVLQEYGVEEIKNRDEINSKIERTIELVQEESAQRQRANMLATGQETYKTQVEEAQKAFEERLRGDTLGLYGKFSPKIAKELEENSKVISAIVGDIIQQRISLIANKTGEEYEKGLREIYKEIANRLRAVGISEETIQAQFTQFSQNHGVYKVGLDSFIQSLQTSREELDNLNNKTEANYNATKRATQSTMSFTEKVDANARALRNNANDAVSLYNKIYDIVKIAQQNHVINFDLKLTAQKPPQWMQNIDLPELQRLAARFTAIAQSGGHAKGYTRETTYEQGLLYASAAREKQYKEERQALEDRNKHDKKTKSSGGAKKDPFAESLKDEIELINNIQKRYNEYRKMGVSAQEAITKAAEEYNNTLMRVNATLSKYGVQTKSAQELANMDLREVRDYYKSLLDVAKGANNAKGIESLEKAIANINVEITKADYKKLTDGLNNELGKLKEEYELGIELDANPELGDVFADMMGIDESELRELPRTFNQVVTKMQASVDKLFAENNIQQSFDLATMLDKNDFEKWAKEQGQTLDSAFVKSLNSIREYANKVRLDEAKAATKNWSDLVEKYGDLQSKIIKIYKETVQEQLSIIRQFGNDSQQSQALDIVSRIKVSSNPQEIARLQAELADVLSKVTSSNKVAANVANAAFKMQDSKIASATWGDFKDSDLYTMTFEDMSNNSTHAIQLIIDKLETLKNQVKEDPASMKALMQSLKQAQSELESRDPYLAITSSIREMRQASAEAKLAQQELADATKEVEAAQRELDESEDANPEIQAKARERLTLAIQRQSNAEIKVVQAENKQQKASKKLQNGLQGLSGQLENVQGLFTSVAKLFEAAGDDDTAEAINAISEGFSVMTTVIMGVVAAMIVLQSTSPYLLAIAAALSVIIGLVSFLSGNNNKKITEQVEASERAVKRLEIAYVDLQHAIDNAYGTSVVGAKKAAQANKELQLEELRRQLILEKSRDSKDRDDDKILDLQKNIKELQYEIMDMTNEIVNDLMGVSSVGDFAENLVESMIDAFREGEDYMEVFEGKFEEMIDNMIMKSIVSRVMTQYMDNLWESIDKRITSRSEKEAEAYAEAQLRNSDIKNMNDMEVLTTFGGYSSYDAFMLQQSNASKFKRIADEYRKAAADAEKSTKQALDSVSAINDSDISWVMEQLGQTTPELAERLKELISQYYSFGDKADPSKNLSGLQQGIQSVTEETAGALEAYMNSVSQQVYLHSDLLTQIRDAVVGFDLDVQTATVSQILLQLQNSYQVQMSIQSILNGWSNPNGMAVRVEMVS